MHYTKLSSQGDNPVRVVLLSNLIAMCERGSGITHTFEVVEKYGTGRCAVSYSNPDEYGHEAPVRFSMPTYLNPFEVDNPNVVMAVVRSTGGRDVFDREAAFQAFDAAVLSADKLWRSTPKGSDWRTEAEIAADRAENDAALDSQADEQIRQGREIDDEWERSQ